MNSLRRARFYWACLCLLVALALVATSQLARTGLPGQNTSLVGGILMALGLSMPWYAGTVGRRLVGVVVVTGIGAALVARAGLMNLGQ